MSSARIPLTRPAFWLVLERSWIRFLKTSHTPSLWTEFGRFSRKMPSTAPLPPPVMLRTSLSKIRTPLWLVARMPKLWVDDPPMSFAADPPITEFPPPLVPTSQPASRTVVLPASEIPA